jgi:hypothetical protein
MPRAALVFGGADARPHDWPAELHHVELRVMELPRRLANDKSRTARPGCATQSPAIEGNSSAELLGSHRETSPVRVRLAPFGRTPATAVVPLPSGTPRAATPVVALLFLIRTGPGTRRRRTPAPSAPADVGGWSRRGDVPIPNPLPPRHRPAAT